MTTFAAFVSYTHAVARAMLVRVPILGVSVLFLAGAGGRPESWPLAGRDQQGTYHSPLADINTANVSHLGFAWEYQTGTRRGLEATPIVVDGVLYTAGNFGVVYALDAATGAERWVYDPGVDGQWGRYACCDAVNRGVAAARGRIYVAGLDGFLHAVDATSGKRIWKVDTLPARGPRSPYTITGAPVIAGDLVIIGAGGGDFHGVRGYVAAFDLRTGKLRWRFYTVPRDPALGPQDQSHLVQAVKTWDPRHRWETGGGGPVWDGISYDPDLKLIYIGTGNAAPYDIKEDGRRGGDNLYTASILALHDDGRLAWHYQVVPGDMWDFDSTQKMILADVTVAAKPRKVLMQASKNGFFYVLDRVTGALISAQAYAFANWTKGIDPKTGRPIPNPDVDYQNSPKLVFPWEGGAHSWQPMSFDPGTQLVYIPVMETPDVQIESAHLPAGLVEGQFTSPIIPVEDFDPPALQSLYGAVPPLDSLAQGMPPAIGRGFLRAWDPLKQRLAWEVPTEPYWNGGVISTDGGLVIQGDIAGRLNVYAASSGQLLKSIDTGSTIMAAPMTYRVNDVQYVAVMAGYGGGQIGVPFPEKSAAYGHGNAGRILAFKLGGGAVPIPPAVVTSPFPLPPPREGTAAQIGAGEVLYNRYCSRCHVFGPGVLPDLRRLTPEKHALFYDIVLKGMLTPLGMGRFDDVLTRADAQAIHAYLLDESWNAAAPPVSGPVAGAQRPLSALPVAANVKVPPGPGWLGVGFGSVWLSKSQSKVVLRIDPATSKVIASIPVGPDAELGIGIGLGSVWIADTKDRSLRQIDPASNKVVRTFPVNIPEEPEGSIGVGLGNVWLLTNDNGTDSGTLSRLDPVTGKTIATIPVKPKSYAVLVTDDAVWVSNTSDASLQRIDPSTNKVVAEVAVHASPRFLAAGEGGIWVWCQGDGTLARIDPATNRLVAIIPVGFAGPGGDLWIEDGIVWVSAEGAPINMIDPKSNQLVKQFVGGEKLDTLRVTNGAVWLVEELTGKIWKVSVSALK